MLNLILSDPSLQLGTPAPPRSPAPTRQVGLDPSAFTFASFNQPFKLSPELFATWLRVLLRVPHAQLWVLALNEGAGAEPALRAAARAAGVDQSRRVPLACARAARGRPLPQPLPCKGRTFLIRPYTVLLLRWQNFLNPSVYRLTS
jgi:hypothetical protein